MEYENGTNTKAHTDTHVLLLPGCKDHYYLIKAIAQKAKAVAESHPNLPEIYVFGLVEGALEMNEWIERIGIRHTLQMILI